MNKDEFERLLDVCCGTLTHEARASGFSTSSQFENRVRQVLDDLLKDETSLKVDFTPPPQEFPDIALGEYALKLSLRCPTPGRVSRIVFSNRKERMG